METTMTKPRTDKEMLEAMRVELEKLGLGHKVGYDLGNYRSAWGKCFMGKRLRISLSRPLNRYNSPESMRNTILHEIAHAMDFLERGTTDHGPKWQRIALSIGCDAKRGKHTLEIAAHDEKIFKYRLECTGTCGIAGHMNRRPTRSFLCKSCHSTIAVVQLR
jgi:predicted SprT family Zn-dependent metalloprotease